MECDCLPFSEIPQTTKLFAAFTENFDKLKEFYGHAPDASGVRAAAKEVRLDAATRKAVVEVLRVQNSELGGDPATAANIDRLANGAAAIVTGQQVGLFSGPAYSIYKALDAIAWARNLTRSGVDAVPIFWMATEDHDLAEANQVFFGERYGIARMELPLAAGVQGRSVGPIALGMPAEAVVEHALGILRGPGRKEVAEALQAAYRPEETFASAFGKLLARILKGRGLVLLDPLDPRLHQLARPVFQKAVEDVAAMTEKLLARGKELERRGFHAQVKVTGQSTLLFLNVDGKREALRRKNGGLVAGKLQLSTSDLLGKIEAEPEALTPSVLLRPVLEDSILPTAAYIGGPAEVAYMAQAQVVYREVLGRMPAILPRAGFTLLEPQVARTLQKYGFDVREVFGGRQRMRRRMEAQYLPRGLAGRFARDEKALRRILAGYEKALRAVDKTLAGARKTAERKMLYQFDKLRGKAGRAENERTGVVDRHESEIVSALYPHHGLQERTLCLLPFLAGQGMELLERLESAMSQPCPCHRIMKL